MNRQQKETFIQELKKDLTENTGVFLVGYKGLRVSQMTTLRKKLREQDGAFQVIKVTLIKRALQGNDFAGELEPMLKNQIALVFARTENSSVAKVLSDFSKTHKQLAVLAGCVENKFLNAQDFDVFVSLPSREVLLAQICGTLNAPVTNFVVVLKMLMTRLVVVLNQIEQQKAKSS
jgi:large subunit ribosomal protein L10